MALLIMSSILDLMSCSFSNSASSRSKFAAAAADAEEEDEAADELVVPRPVFFLPVPFLAVLVRGPPAGLPSF